METTDYREYVNENNKRVIEYKYGKMNVKITVEKEMSEIGVRNFNKLFNDISHKFLVKEKGANI